MALLTHVTPTGTESWDVDPVSFFTLAMTATGAYAAFSWVKRHLHART